MYLYITETEVPRNNSRGYMEFPVFFGDGEGKGWGGSWATAIHNLKNRTNPTFRFIGKNIQVCRYVISPSQWNLCDLSSFIYQIPTMKSELFTLWPQTTSISRFCILLIIAGWLLPKDLEQGQQTSHLTNPITKENNPHFLLECKNSKTM